MKKSRKTSPLRSLRFPKDYLFRRENEDFSEHWQMIVLNWGEEPFFTQWTVSTDEMEIPLSVWLGSGVTLRKTKSWGNGGKIWPMRVFNEISQKNARGLATNRHWVLHLVWRSTEVANSLFSKLFPSLRAKRLTNEELFTTSGFAIPPLYSPLQERGPC